jgi:hypothetical protein
MRITVNVLTGIVCALWAVLAWVGIDLLRHVAAQHVPGYPAPGQMFYYVKVSVTMVVILICTGILFNGIVRHRVGLVVQGIILLILFFGLPFYLVPYGGGV